MTGMITSLQNSTVKLAASLKQRKHREATGLFMAEGVRLVEEAIGSNWRIESCLYTEQALANQRVQAIINTLSARDCRLLAVSGAVYAKISDTEQPQGIMTLIRRNSQALSSVLDTDQALLVILDGLQDPGNLGAVIRTADAAGATAVILTKGCTDLYAGKAVRSTMGSLFHIPLVEGVIYEDLIHLLQEQDIALLATSLASARNYLAADYKQPVAIVFGNEGQGVNPVLLDKAEERIYIPILGRAESLNVAAAAAVILYEAVRQRC
ncbi:RNA methyltransferase|uniref:RNA methyltransferase, TrmH family n=2 Tax=Dendrosporobacter quercicolus TaxID=146817 RepID=A0A1G9KHR5_9FIRM|nr:RNA methyltransferase [Dendrosporobacter quercicolus DSM 1736]SDL49152.1 RNA methyltransferase, TrmH family [Dendrosporobacter quercicolus]